jgi:hypothetical protein
MSWYLWALVGGAVVATALAWRVPRAVLWIGLGALSFMASSIWNDWHLPYPAAFGAFADLAVCFALYAQAQLKWEMRVWNCFHLMIVIELLYLSGWIYSHYDYALALELANWLALLIISSAGVAERTGYGPAWAFARRSTSGWAGALHRRIYAKRDDPPFWQVNE